MSVINLSQIKKELGLEPNGRVQRAFQMACSKAMDRFVPMSDLESAGDLRTNVDLSNPKKIIYESPYAHAQYVGLTTGPVRNYTTAGTGPYWDLRMWTSRKDEVIRAVKNEIMRGGK